MSASLHLKVGVLAAVLSCMLAGQAAAQLQELREQAVGERSRTSQIDRPTTQPAQRGQPYTAQFRGTQATGTAASMDLEHYLAQCLLIKNQAEIELSQFAQQQAQNPEIKQFAQELIKDHQQAAQKLQQLAGMQGQGTGRSSQASGARGQNDAQRQQPGADRSELRTSTNTQITEPGLTQGANQSLTADRSGAQGGAWNELLELDRQITERCTEMIREELQAKRGPEFDHCFVSAQIGSHTHMLAALEVIGQRAQGDLKQVVDEARPVVQRHLDHAKQLAKQLHSDTQTGAQAERQPGRTQR
jgi:predicted outer membrane protein